MQKPHTFQNVNVPNPVKKPKGKIVKIELTDEQKEEIRHILACEPPKKVRDKYEEMGITDIKLMKYNPPGNKSRLEAVRRIVGGLCGVCGKYNTHLVKYKLDGITLVERYCSEHVPDMI